MTATFVHWGMQYDWAWFLATVIGILVIALPLMLAVAMVIYAERKIWAAMALVPATSPKRSTSSIR